MPAKLTTVTYIHTVTERIASEYTIKEMTGVTRLDDEDPTKIIYLKIKAFIPIDRSIETHIEDFESGQVVHLRGKFVAFENWYTVNATSIKPIINLDFETMPAVGISVMVVGSTSQTVKNVDGNSVLEFHVEENIGDREPSEFSLEIQHNPNHTYLANKTNSINQSMRSTNAILMGLLHYQPPTIDAITGDETVPGKHILQLDDISLISTIRANTSSQSMNLPWLNQRNNPNRTQRTPRGSTPRTRRGRTLSQMPSTSSANTFTSVLETNPPPQNMINSENDATDS